jgi:hypothetical protein
MPPRHAALVLAAIVVILAVTAFPYVYAAAASGDGYQFGGFLINPLDGNSYLAKMRLGWQGGWQFHLPYTAETGQGSYLFLFYLFLGHVSHWLSLPLIWTFHIARLLAAAFMYSAAYIFFRAVFPEARQTILAFILTAFGSGLGWLALFIGQVSSDFWVAEAYPFLSAYANPHFPLGLGLLLLIFLPAVRQVSPAAQARAGWVGTIVSPPWVSGLLSFVLAVAAPFGVVIAVTVYAGCLLWAFLQPTAGFSPRWHFIRTVWICLGGAPVLVYDLWAAARDPLLRSWNAQNLTPSPALWDLALSFSPLLILAVLGAGWLLWGEFRGESSWGAGWRLPLVWLVLALVILYLPVGLQRRFIMGLYIPMAIFAVAGVSWISTGKKRRFVILSFLVVMLAAPTNLMVLMSARFGALSRDPQIYLSRAEAQAVAWLVENTPQDSLVLASPSTGLFIPAHSGRRVIYGHPFETVHANQEKSAVQAFFSSSSPETQIQFVRERGVDYLFYGPREQQFGGLTLSDIFQPVFQSGDVVIYAAPENDLP